MQPQGESKGSGQENSEGGIATAGSVVATAGNREEKLMSMEEEEGYYVTDEGEIIPKDGDEQEAEAKRGPNAHEEVEIEGGV